MDLLVGGARPQMAYIDDRIELAPCEIQIKKSDGNYLPLQIQSVIGRGGSCIVYKAFEEQTPGNPTRIVKEFYPRGLKGIVRNGRCIEIAEDVTSIFNERRARFEEGISQYVKYYEVSDLSAAPRPFWFGEANGTVYSVSDTSTGKILADIDRQGLTVARVASIACSLCEAIFRFHDSGLLYLDCKPDNIFFYSLGHDEDHVRLFDFDTVMSIDEIKAHPEMRSYSKGWAPSELVSGNVEEIGKKTDIFSVGAVFFWLLTGRSPLERITDRIDIENGRFFWKRNPPLKSCSAEAIQLIQHISERSLLDPENRYDDISALEKDFRKLYDITIGPSKSIHDDLRDIKDSIETLSGDVNKLARKSTAVKLNYFGANKDHVSTTTRYCYDSCSTKCLGRESELRVLFSFCEDDAQLAWICVSGGLDTGKKRLVYEFFEKLDECPGWIHTKIINRMPDLNGILNEIDTNAVVCIEYAGEYLEDIEEFLVRAEQKIYYSPNKIRLIFIERNATALIEEESISAYHYHTDICLTPLPPEEMRKVIAEYRGTSDGLDMIYASYLKTDPTGSNIILALLEADRYEDKSDLSALDYWYQKQKDAIRATSKTISVSEVIRVLAFATLCGGGELVGILSDLGLEISDDWINTLSTLRYLDNNEIVGAGISVLGLHLCVQYFNESGDAQNMIALVLEKDIHHASAVLDAIYTNYETTLSGYPWREAITDLVLPNSTKRIDASLFRGKAFIHRLFVGSSIHEIGRCAFLGCPNLSEISFSPDLETIEPSAFRDCVSLSKFYSDNPRVKSSLREIGREAFKGCKSLQTIDIPKSCKLFGEAVFYRCGSLRHIDIPSSVGEISHEMFAYCESLQTIRIPQKCRSIGASAFFKATSLRRIVGAESVEVIGSKAFRSCSSLLELPPFPSLKYVGQQAFELDTSLQHVDFSTSSISTISQKLFANCGQLTDVILPSSVTEIDESAFINDKLLSSMDGLEYVTRIKARAFKDCSSLKVLLLPKKLKYLGAQALDGCEQLSCEYRFESPICFCGLYYSSKINFNKEEITQFTHQSHLVDLSISSHVSKIERETFANMPNLQTAMIAGSVNEIGPSCFKGCRNLVSATINVKKVADSAFMSCENLKTVVLGAKVASIGYGCFEGCSRLSTIKTPAKQKLQIGPHAFSDVPLRQWPMVDLTNLCGFSFHYFGAAERDFLLTLSNRDEIIVPKTVYKFQERAFAGLNRVKTITFLAPIRSIPAQAFSGCTELECIRFQGVLTSVGKEAFLGCKKLAQIGLSNDFSKTQISYGEFDGCESLEEIVISKDISKIGDFAFRNCRKLRVIVTASQNDNIEEGLFETPDTLTIIGQYAFSGCESLTAIKLGNSVRTVGTGAFSCCTNLISADFSRSSVGMLQNNLLQSDKNLRYFKPPKHLESIGYGAFKDCEAIERIPIPPTVRDIGLAAFQHCISLISIQIPRSITTIKSHTFRNCFALEEVRGGEGIKQIGSSAFYQCISLKDAALANLTRNAEQIESAAFYSCRNLQELNLPTSVSDVQDCAFERCSGLLRVSLPSKLTRIPANLLKDCYALEEVSVPTDAIYIGPGAFRNCLNLRSINLPHRIIKIPPRAFYGCSSLSRLDLPSKISEIGDSAFAKCKSLKEVSLNCVISDIRDYAFIGCTSLVSFPFEMLDGTLGIAAFMDCESLKAVNLGNVQAMLPSAFRGCSSITDVEVKNMDCIPGAAFRGCTKLRTVHLASRVTAIKKSAFRECGALEDVTIDADTITVEDNAFTDCPMLDYILLPENCTVSPVAFVNTPASAYVY